MTLDELTRCRETLWRLCELLYESGERVNNPIYDAYNRARIEELDLIITNKENKQDDQKIDPLLRS